MPQSVGVWTLTRRRRAATQKIVFPTSRPGFPTDAHVEPRDRDHEGGRRPRDPQPAVPAEGHQARRAAAGDHLRARRSGAADAARLSLHAVLPLGVRHQSVAGQPGLRRDVDQLPQRRRLRPVVPHRAEHRRRGNSEYQDVVAGAKYLQSRAGRRSEARRHLGPVVRRPAHVAGARAQLRHLRGRRRSRGRAPLRQLARSGGGVVQVVGDLARSTAGSRRCCSSRATTTATWTSRR